VTRWARLAARLGMEAAGIEPAPGGAKPSAESRPYLATTRNDSESLSRRVPCRPVLSQHVPQAPATYVQHGGGRALTLTGAHAAPPSRSFRQRPEGVYLVPLRGPWRQPARARVVRGSNLQPCSQPAGQGCNGRTSPARSSNSRTRVASATCSGLEAVNRSRDGHYRGRRAGTLYAEHSAQ